MALGQEADKGGFRFTISPPSERVDALLRFQALAACSALHSTAMIGGRTQSGPFEVFDLTKVWVYSKSRSYNSLTAFILPGAVGGVPNLIVTPLGIAGYLGLAKNPLRVPGEDAFNRRFGLASTHYQEAPCCISAELVAVCEAEGRIAFESRDGDLLVYRPGEYLRPSQLEPRLSIAIEIARLLRDAADNQHLKPRKR